MASLQHFQGRERLIQRIDQVHENGFSPERLCRALEALYREGGIALPSRLLTPTHDHYLRRQLHACERFGYVLIAMTWGPGQGSPLHDHDGSWCVECLWHGSLSITPHELLQQDLDGRSRFTARPAILAQAGRGDWLEAENGYHTMRNPDSDTTAVSLHVYPNTFQQCGWFEPEQDGWYRRHALALACDPYE